MAEAASETTLLKNLVDQVSKNMEDMKKGIEDAVMKIPESAKQSMDVLLEEVSSKLRGVEGVLSGSAKTELENLASICSSRITELENNTIAKLRRKSEGAQVKLWDIYKQARELLGERVNELEKRTKELQEYIQGLVEESCKKLQQYAKESLNELAKLTKQYLS